MKYANITILLISFSFFVIGVPLLLVSNKLIFPFLSIRCHGTSSGRMLCIIELHHIQLQALANHISFFDHIEIHLRIIHIQALRASFSLKLVHVITIISSDCTTEHGPSIV